MNQLMTLTQDGSGTNSVKRISHDVTAVSVVPTANAGFPEAFSGFLVITNS
jgi:hypothetical protein